MDRLRGGMNCCTVVEVLCSGQSDDDDEDDDMEYRIIVFAMRSSTKYEVQVSYLLMHSRTHARMQGSTTVQVRLPQA